MRDLDGDVWLAAHVAGRVEKKVEEVIYSYDQITVLLGYLLALALGYVFHMEFLEQNDARIEQLVVESK